MNVCAVGEYAPGNSQEQHSGRRSTLVSTAAGDAARRPPTLGDGETMQDVQLSADVEALELRCNEPLRSRTTRLTSSPGCAACAHAHLLPAAHAHPATDTSMSRTAQAVSYTHLTLPTILLV